MHIALLALGREWVVGLLGLAYGFFYEDSLQKPNWSRRSMLAIKKLATRYWKLGNSEGWSCTILSSQKVVNHQPSFRKGNQH